jgi:hypothetical protein
LQQALAAGGDQIARKVGYGGDRARRPLGQQAFDISKLRRQQNHQPIHWRGRRQARRWVLLLDLGVQGQWVSLALATRLKRPLLI